MRSLHLLTALLLLSVGNGAVRAGLHYSGETYAELPSQWRGFLLDQRLLRTAAVKPAAGIAPGPVRTRYELEAARLEKARQERKLTADELADLGALHVRLGEAAKAVELLRTAQREHPHSFRIAANLGTAWQMHGNLAEAAAALEQAVPLAPGKWQKAEELHLKLVRLRQREPAGSQELDDLFGIRYLADGGRYEPGKLAEPERATLPANAPALVQQLALWLPADARLLWQLAELAAVKGDVRTAAAIMDGCVGEFALGSAELRRRRQLTRTVADELARQAAAAGEGAKATHEGHAGALEPRSSRPLLTKLDAVPLPPVRADALNPLPWSVVADTTLDRKYRPAFAKYLQELEGKQVALTGYMQALGDELQTGSFMLIEYPIGCWYCEMPDITGIVFVELPAGKARPVTRKPVRVEGTLSLNATDPENFLYTIGKAKVTDAD